jgi:hypothetical protein
MRRRSPPTRPGGSTTSPAAVPSGLLIRHDVEA